MCVDMCIKVKVVKINQEQSNPFKNRIPKWEWVRWLGNAILILC
jgi:hypothetical protein